MKKIKICFVVLGLISSLNIAMASKKPQTLNSTNKIQNSKETKNNKEKDMITKKQKTNLEFYLGESVKSYYKSMNESLLKGEQFEFEYKNGKNLYLIKFKQIPKDKKENNSTNFHLILKEKLENKKNEFKIIYDETGEYNNNKNANSFVKGDTKKVTANNNLEQNKTTGNLKTKLSDEDKKIKEIEEQIEETKRNEDEIKKYIKMINDDNIINSNEKISDAKTNKDKVSNQTIEKFKNIDLKSLKEFKNNLEKLKTKAFNSQQEAKEELERLKEKIEMPSKKLEYEEAKEDLEYINEILQDIKKFIKETEIDVLCTDLKEINKTYLKNSKKENEEIDKIKKESDEAAIEKALKKILNHIKDNIEKKIKSLNEDKKFQEYLAKLKKGRRFFKLSK